LKSNILVPINWNALGSWSDHAYWVFFCFMSAKFFLFMSPLLWAESYIGFLRWIFEWKKLLNDLKVCLLFSW
jgi:hypothetical protein